MIMRVITWNMRKATKKSLAWEILKTVNPDIALLQEVMEIPETIQAEYSILSRRAIYKTGKPQKFKTVVMVKGEILKEISLSAEYDRVNKELEFFKGNIIGCTAKLANYSNINIVSIYSPARPVDVSKYPNIDVNTIKLQGNPKVWMTEIFWAGLKNRDLTALPRIIGGDLNSSETFDRERQKENNIKTKGISSLGSRKMLNRMKELGFTECLRQYNGKITPTFKHSRGGIIHQMDHLFTTKTFAEKLKKCNIFDQSVIFGESISDHLPIIADFEPKKFSIPQKIIEFINKNEWLFAKTYADFAPHEYVVKEKISKEEQEIFLEFVLFIREFGYKKIFADVEYTYYDIDHYMYWTMGNPIETTNILNRALIKNTP